MPAFDKSNLPLWILAALLTLLVLFSVLTNYGAGRTERSRLPTTTTTTQGEMP